MTPGDERAISRIIEFASQLGEMIFEQGITREVVSTQRYVQWAITTPLYNIGELVSHISRPLKAEHPDIPWSKISGLRHRLVHDYKGTDWDIINTIIFEDLPEFVGQLQSIVR
ncbi:HepT-like ribonuclease domain-containing protein [Curtanaerobium respiraculi]|uniref:HepT-like ribonuclease domain-containing protein n=1 Tax=Curtanaerobium respiraculi TaxID=2949669 RepID=UPI0024B3413A|nr:HepT-like ribonuclease domain-containing protein [Curtanaerobium respiraculi]